MSRSDENISKNQDDLSNKIQINSQNEEKG